MQELSKFVNPSDLRILLVDDNPRNLQILGNQLKSLSYQIFFALDGEHALSAVRQHRPHLILLDIQMPGMDGFELCRQLKAESETADIPVIFLTAAYRDSDSLLEGFRVGAVDYITKPYLREELVARVETHLKLKAYQDYFRDLSIRDPLTRLYNRRFMGDKIAHEKARRIRDGAVFTIALADLDNFKQINDRYGHGCGDAVLVEAARALQNGVRATDAVGRWGGEEFLILLPDTDLAGAKAVLERLMDELRALSIPCENEAISPTMTCGAADSRQGADAEAVIRHADAAMYHGKTAGKNRLVVFSEELDARGPS